MALLTCGTGTLRRLAAAVLCAAALLTAASAADTGDAVIGQAGTRYTGVGDPDSRSAETGLGNAVADAVRAAAETPYAIVPGGLIVNNLIAGEVTRGELELLFAEDAPLAVAELTTAELKALLEECVGHIVLDDVQAVDEAASAFDGYPQISGFTLRYDVSAPVGARVTRIEDADGQALNLTDTARILRIASIEGLFDGSYGLTPRAYVLLDATVLEAMEDFTRAGGLTGEETGRVRVIGSSDNTLLGDFPVVLAALTLILLVLAFRVFYHPKPSFANGFKMPPKSERYDDMELPPEADEKEEHT